MQVFLIEPDQRFPRFESSYEFDGQRWTYRFSWNAKTAQWYFDATDSDGVRVLSGERVGVSQVIGLSRDVPRFIGTGRDDHTSFEDWAARRMMVFHVTGI